MNIRKKIRDLMGVSFLDTLYKTFLYRDLLLTTSTHYEKWVIARTRKAQERKIEALRREKKPLTVVFFLQNASIWKYGTLYRLMEQSPLFHPVVVISPYNVHLIYDKAECLNVMKKTEAFAQKEGYEYVSAYDWEKHQWRNIKRMLKPDVVFFTKPYKDTLPQYHIYRFRDALTLYMSYGIPCVDLYRTNFNLPFHNLLWKFLLETDIHQELSTQYSVSEGDNGCVIGALGVELLMRNDYQPTDVWKPQAKPKKRIIWAPHHTVDYLFNFSNFLVYSEDMFRLAEKYKDEVQIAFKPHPVLKFKLINLWGKERVEAYYQKWADLENTQLADGDYMDLFLTSDALIHDCGSFTAEYLYTGKPVLFMVRDKEVEKHWNTFGKKCFEQHYHAESIAEIEAFIEHVILEGNDTMQPQRLAFQKQYLLPKDGILPSQKVFNLLSNIVKA